MIPASDDSSQTNLAATYILDNLSFEEEAIKSVDC
jgi:hypothetical protein